MVIWLALLVPFATAAVLAARFAHRTTWWEFLLPFALSAALVAGFKLSVETTQVTDQEYWTGAVARAVYSEPWDQVVPCGHPEYCTETTYDAQGEPHTTTSRCGWQHPYDVEMHGPEWRATDTNGVEVRIDGDAFERLALRLRDRRFVDMHRDSYTIHGNAFETAWDGSDERMEVMTTLHSYENRVAASSATRFPDVDPRRYGLFDYPPVRDFYACPSVLGASGPEAERAERVLAVTNARLGPTRQVRAWILVFRDRPVEAALEQEAYWQGGNKNEFVLAVGVGADDAVLWCRPFSWTKAEDLKSDARDFVTAQGRFDVVKTAEWLGPALDAKFRRRSFSEFSYLTVEPPAWAVAVTFLVTALANWGLAVWIVRNRRSPRAAPEPAASRRAGPTHPTG